MSVELIVAIAGVVLALSGVAFFVYKKLPKRNKTHKNVSEWRDVQSLLADQRTWPEAVVQADFLLDKMMKNRRCEGKTTGERMVSCQNKFSNNDAIWKAHKLAIKIRDDKSFNSKIDEKEMKSTMMAFGQAMKDIGAL